MSVICGYFIWTEEQQWRLKWLFLKLFIMSHLQCYLTNISSEEQHQWDCNNCLSWVICTVTNMYMNGGTTTVRLKWVFSQLFIMSYLHCYLTCISTEEQQQWGWNDFSKNCSRVICSYFISTEEQQRWDWNDYSSNCSSCQSFVLLLCIDRGTI